MESSNEGIVFVAHLGFYGSGYPHPWRESMGLVYVPTMNSVNSYGFHVVVNIPNSWEIRRGFFGALFLGTPGFL